MRTRPFAALVALAMGSMGLAALPAAATDEPDARAAFLTGPNDGTPEEIATSYLEDEAGSFGLTDADVAELHVRSSYVSSHTGVTHVNLNQRYQGLEVFGADTTVTVAADGSVVFVGGASVSGLPDGAPRGLAVHDPELDPIEAVEAAADELDLAEPVDLREVPAARAADPTETVVTDGGISDEPIPVSLGWAAVDDGLRLAYQVVIDDNSDVHLWNATVDATTGVLLEVQDWTSDSDHATLTEALRRTDAATTTVAPAGLETAATPIVTPDPVRDGSSYRVFPLPLESPNDGGRTLITEPADATASPYGWHDVSGTSEPDFTITRGNNTNAYTDWNNSNSPLGGALVVTVEPPSSAAGTYTAAAAAYGPPATPEGITGPIVVVDDGTGTPSEGCSPLVDFPEGAIALVDRGTCPFVDKTLNAQAAGAVAVIVANNVAGPPTTLGGTAPGATIPSVMISLDDGTTVRAGLPADGGVSFTPVQSQPDGGPSLTFDHDLDLADHPHDYWEAAVTNLFYWCNVAHDVFHGFGFDEPSGNFQANNYGRGGVGGDDVQCEAQDGGGMNNANFSTPAADGGTPRMQMYLWNVGPEPQRDGDLEAGIILHEYSHGVSNRLTGGPGINCLTGDQRMGEGWSDFHGIVTLIDPSLDDPEGPRGMGTYALWQDDPPRQGAGIRPAPYSRDMTIQPFTFDSIRSGGWVGGATLAAPHHIGHGWAAILWDLSWDLIDKHGFNPDLYADWSAGGNLLVQQLVMDGLKYQGCAPGFVDGRDAIIAAETVLTGGDDFCTIWAAFARRGVGFSAEQDALNRRNLGGDPSVSFEAFDTHPDCLRGFQAPVRSALNEAGAGDSVPLRFDVGALRGDDVLATNSPFSRQVDCDSLAVVSESEHITPRARPVPTTTQGSSRLNVNGQGVASYNWRTDADWSGTCREVVVTRTDGLQHRAFFRFA